uniref:Uncharacterized protein n=1 Tax=Pinguiococcus pyrenoidosus TaxID=172671 RepID=A0A7R9UAC6_9STRA
MARRRLARMRGALPVLLRFFRSAFLRIRLRVIRQRVLRKRDSTISTLSSLTRFSNASSKDFAPKTPLGPRSKGFAPRLRVVRKRDRDMRCLALAFQKLKLATASRQFFLLRDSFVRDLASKANAGYCGDPLRDVSPRELSIGTEVLCRYQESPIFYVGRVSRIRVDKTQKLYDITYEDGDREMGADRFRIRLPGQKQRKELSVGDFVDARNKSRKRFERGIVLKVVSATPGEEPRYDVLFLGPEPAVESGVRRSHILGGFTWPTPAGEPDEKAKPALHGTPGQRKSSNRSLADQQEAREREALESLRTRRIIHNAYHKSHNFRKRIWRLQAVARGWIARRRAAMMRIGDPAPQGSGCIGRQVYYRCRHEKTPCMRFRYGIVRDWKASADTVCVRFFDNEEVLICDRHEVVFCASCG